MKKAVPLLALLGLVLFLGGVSAGSAGLLETVAVGDLRVVHVETEGETWTSPAVMKVEAEELVLVLEEVLLQAPRERLLEEGLPPGTPVRFQICRAKNGSAWWAQVGLGRHKYARKISLFTFNLCEVANVEWLRKKNRWRNPRIP